MNRERVAAAAKSGSFLGIGGVKVSDKEKATLAKLQAIPRAGLPDDIAAAALFLASDESGFITAEDIIIDGGLIAGRRYAEVLAGGSVWKSAIG